MGKMVPRIAILAVVFSDRPPLAFAQIGTPFLPRCCMRTSLIQPDLLPCHRYISRAFVQHSCRFRVGTQGILLLSGQHAHALLHEVPLVYAFSKLLVNFTWWINRKDRFGNNVFEGGFLGLDNIGVFDRSAELPTGGHLEQADGTAWMVFFSQQMLRISVELALHYPPFEEFVVKFFEHTMWIAGAMDRMGENHDKMWDEEDGFFYDVLRLPNGDAFRLKVRSMVGLVGGCICRW
jgi:hypothetical protein